MQTKYRADSITGLEDTEMSLYSAILKIFLLWLTLKQTFILNTFSKAMYWY